MELFGLILETLLLGEKNLQVVVHRIRVYPLVDSEVALVYLTQQKNI